ncbi:hypothetical protein AOLI_G00211610 [Acnodon oligacanthus]
MREQGTWRARGTILVSKEKVRNSSESILCFTSGAGKLQIPSYSAAAGLRSGETTLHTVRTDYLNRPFSQVQLSTSIDF